MSRNLITGGLGFLGSYLSRRLLEMGEEVVIFDLGTSTRLLEDIKDRIKIVRGDLTNWVDVFEAIKNHNIDCIYHACAILPPASEQNPSVAYAVNVTGTFNVLEVARLLNVGSVIFFSSISTYGPGAPLVINEDVQQMPKNMYGVTKVCGERLGEYYHRRFGVNFRGLRLPVTIGPGRLIPPHVVWAWMVVQETALGRPYTITAEETAHVPLLYIKDVVESLIGIRDAPEAKLKRRIYNVHGFSPTARELADVVLKYLPKAKIGFRPEKSVMDIIRDWPRAMDPTRASQDWGWKLKYDLPAAVKDFIAEVQANPDRYR